MSKELSPDQLRNTIDPESLGIEDTENFENLSGIIGQERAVDALEFGLHMKGKGYNIYVSGPPGIGKMTSVKSYIEKIAKHEEVPNDICYINNFEDSYNPKVIQLPGGKGCILKNDMTSFINHVKNELPKAFEGEEYTAEKESITGEFNHKRDELTKELSDRAGEKGFSLQPNQMGVMIIPFKEGKPLKDEEFQALPEAEREAIQVEREEIQKEVKVLFKKIRALDAETQKKIKNLDKNIALHIVGGMIDDLIDKYKEYNRVISYLKAVREDVLNNIEMFKAKTEQQSQVPVSPQEMQQKEEMRAITLKRYEVNLLVDNCRTRGAPVIVENNPTFYNLIGRIEKEMKMGALTTDFTMIRAGSIPRANGGFLVISVEDVLRGTFSYEGLKRTLKSGEIHIEELGERMGYMTVKTIRPEPIPINLKVILVGSPMYFYQMQIYDEDFQELFKVRADFDTSMDVNDSNRKDFISFISTFCNRERLRHLDKSAVTRVLEHASRMVEDQEKLSIKFGVLGDLIREADFWAEKDEARLIESHHVKKALDAKIFRSNLIQKRMQEMIERGSILIDTNGERAGQINGLSVISLGGFMFGRPGRITATVKPGKGGIIDIEREVKLGGPLHSKGVMILGGFMDYRFSNGKALTMSARLVFEQSYEGIEGDSASSTELYAILSALSGVPIKQGIAVTGSVDQYGQVQAIGGVNYKIEGFYDICNAKGLTGSQGVMVPESNTKNLMLREDVVEAVNNKKYHIWSVNSIEEGIEILTGTPAGERQEDGTFPEESVYGKVSARLNAFEESMKDVKAQEENKEAQNKS